jgi:hypothetical protein
MNLDELMAVWKSQDAAPLHDANKALLHQVLRQEQAKLERQRRRVRWFMYAVNVVLLITASLFLAIMIDPNQPDTFSARLIVWDYVVGGVGLAAAVTVAGALFALRRSHQVRERGFGDSLRDHLRRRIANLDAEVTGERRLALTMVAAMLTCATAISVVSGRIKHVPVPWSDIVWPSPFTIILILGFFYLLFFRWMPRERRQHVQRKRQLEALLNQLDGQ